MLPLSDKPCLYFFFRKSLSKAFYETKNNVSNNGAAEAINSTQYLSYLLVHMINGSNKDFVFLRVMPLQPRVMIINAGEYKKTRDQIRSSGYVIDTLEAAMMVRMEYG